ncbi:MAG: lysylphosphatidylglycerol synthase domain-containing protein [Elusimicrobiales bacterium]|nr:lysylphosphatidylglycerol synthase domain-containing protein [Elusimicrobiales bacterium]
MAVEMMRIAKKTIPWLVSLAILAALLVKLDLGALPAIFLAADPGPLLLSLAATLFYFFSVSVKKYQYLLAALGVSVSEEEARLIRIGSMPLKAVVPYKAGEFSRAVYLNRLHDVPYKKGVLLIVYGYATRVPVLLAASLGGLLALRTGLDARLIMAAGVLLCASVLALDRKYWKLAFYSVASEALLVASYALIFKAFGIGIPAGELLLYVPLILIMTGLPLSVMGVGVREAAIAAVFASRADFNTLLSGALSVSLIESAIPLLLSMLFLKKFVSGLAAGGREPEAFDPESYFRRRNNNPLTGYRLKRRIREVVGAVGRHCPGRELSVLDIGAADGVMLDAVNSSLSVKRAVGVELFKELIECKKSDRIELVQGKGENLPFGPAEFDVVLICSVIEHVEDAEQTLNEAYKVLRENGRLVLTSVNGFLDKVASLAGIKPDDHLRTYTKGELRELFARHGFRVLEMRSFGPVFYNLTVVEKVSQGE